jgi:3-hydroxyacyl-[acyl-carrier-protein] dehydratase
VTVLAKDEILRRIPHGAEALLISNARVDGKVATSQLQLEGSERCFAGHYPGRPLLPAATLLEIFGQVGAVLTASLGLEPLPDVLVRVQNFRLLQPTVPPAVLHVTVAVETVRFGMVLLRAEAESARGRVAAAQLMVARAGHDA